MIFFILFKCFFFSRCNENIFFLIFLNDQYIKFNVNQNSNGDVVLVGASFKRRDENKKIHIDPENFLRDYGTECGYTLCCWMYPIRFNDGRNK